FFLRGEQLSLGLVQAQSMMNFNPQEHYNQAIHAYQNGQLAKAEQLLRDLHRHFPKLDTVMSTLGGVLVAQGKNKEAVRLLERALKSNPQNPDVLINISAAQQKRGRLKEALNYLQKARKLQPKRADIYYNIANIQMQQGTAQLAEQSFKKALQLQPKLSAAHFNLAQLYRKQGRSHDAIQAYQATLQAQANHEGALTDLGNIWADQGEMEKATALYQKALQVNPQNANTHLLLGKHYLDMGLKDQAETQITQALSLAPNHSDAYIWLGNLARDRQQIQLAEQHYQKALQLDPQNKAAERNWRRMLSLQIPGWHFTMLADQHRNEAYQKVLEKVIQSDSVVLDIGTGSGLLAMMAARAGAKEVVACEMHAKLAETAKEIVKANGYEQKIKVLNKKSTDLKVAVDLSEKTNVLVSEILDVGVIGEGVLPTIRHARKMLLHPNTTIIPARVELFGALIEIPSRSKIAPLKRIAGFDLSPLDRFRVPEEYSTVHLELEEHRMLSEVLPIMEYDFYQLPPAIQDDDPAVKPLSVRIQNTGKAQAFVFWFDLYVDEETMVSSRPGGQLKHWGQALYCFPEIKEVKTGEKVMVQMLHSDQLIAFRW
ncbi:MAG: tetratricopeptide repeat protein, partial [Bacteroidota bacterium]